MKLYSKGSYFFGEMQLGVNSGPNAQQPLQYVQLEIWGYIQPNLVLHHMLVSLVISFIDKKYNVPGTVVRL